MSKTFDFYFDVVSPYSYLAATQLAGLCERTGAVAVWKPFLLGGVMQATGNRPPLASSVPAKQAWLLQDVKDWAAFYGVPLQFPSTGFPFNSLKAQRMLVAAGDLGKTEPLALALFTAAWARGESIAAPECLVAIANTLGLDGAALLARTESQDVKDRLKANTDDAVKLGAFGAPTFVYGGRFYWGNDRMAILEAALGTYPKTGREPSVLGAEGAPCAALE